MLSGFITIKLFGLYPLASHKEGRLTFPVWQSEFISFVDIGDSLLLQACCFLFLLSFLLSPFWFCQQGHRAEEAEKGLKFAVGVSLPHCARWWQSIVLARVPPAGRMLVVSLCPGKGWAN